LHGSLGRAVRCSIDSAVNIAAYVAMGGNISRSASVFRSLGSGRTGRAHVACRAQRRIRGRIGVSVDGLDSLGAGIGGRLRTGARRATDGGTYFRTGTCGTIDRTIRITGHVANHIAVGFAGNVAVASTRIRTGSMAGIEAGINARTARIDTRANVRAATHTNAHRARAHANSATTANIHAYLGICDGGEQSASNHCGQKGLAHVLSPTGLFGGCPSAQLNPAAPRTSLIFATPRP
jgi:hypothetical protein